MYKTLFASLVIYYLKTNKFYFLINQIIYQVALKTIHLNLV